MHAPLNVRLRLLGRLHIAAAGAANAQIRVASKKGAALLAYLAMQPERSASREHLSGVFWGDGSDRNARQNLRQCLAALREDLAPFESELLVLERDTVGLRTDG